MCYRKLFSMFSSNVPQKSVIQGKGGAISVEGCGPVKISNGFQSYDASIDNVLFVPELKNIYFLC